MNWKAFFLTLFVLTLAVAAISAQDDPDDDDSDDEVTYSKPQCLAPAAEKFDEVSFSDKARLDRVIADYQERLYSMPGEAKGYIIVYGGQQTSFTELADITSYVKGHVGLPDRKVGFINGGYRHFATVEFAIEPLECFKVCSRPVTIALSAGGKWTQMYGDFRLGSASEILEAARHYARMANGIVPKEEQSPALKLAQIARLPPG